MLVSLHDETRRIGGTRAVLVQSLIGQPTVVTAPWPRTLSVTTPFAVALTVAAQTTWLRVNYVSIVVSQVPGQSRPAGSLGLLGLWDRPAVAALNLPTVQPDTLEKALQQQPDPARAVAALDPAAFAGLMRSVSSESPPVGGGPAEQLSVPRYSVEAQPPAEVASGICRLLGWD
jgi:hypothetical protein